MTLHEQIQVVHAARLKAARIKALIDTLRAGWEIQWAAEIQESKELAEACATAEAMLREMALQAYAADSTNKAPAPGVGIRVMQRLSYLEAPPWARKYEEPMATIAPDLTSYVEASDAARHD